MMNRLPKAERMPGPKYLHEVSLAAVNRWKELPENLPEAAPYRPETLRELARQLGGLHRA
jgi:hypothetical protein